MMSQYEQDNLTIQLINKAQEGRQTNVKIAYLATTVTSPTSEVDIKLNKGDTSGSYITALLTKSAKQNMIGSNSSDDKLLVATFSGVTIVIDKMA